MAASLKSSSTHSRPARRPTRGNAISPLGAVLDLLAEGET
jgi:hypothetical protein